jgi:hypothetical protein
VCGFSFGSLSALGDLLGTYRPVSRQRSFIWLPFTTPLPPLAARSVVQLASERVKDQSTLTDSVIHEVDNRARQLKDSIFRWDELLLLEGPYV